MKNKKVFVVLLIIFGVICLWNIVNTILRISKDAELNAMTQDKVQKYFSNQDNFDYYKARARHSMSLGLDLQGGMYVTLEIGVADVVKGLAGTNAEDTVFKQAFAVAVRNSTEGNFIDRFVGELTRLKPDAKLGAYFANNQDIRVNTENDKIVDYLKREAQSAIDRSYEIIRTRIDQFGVTSPNIQRVPGTNRILVELPGVKDASRVRRLLRGTANLEFWPTHTAGEMGEVMQRIAVAVNDVEKGKPEEKAAPTANDSTKVASDSSGKTAEDKLFAENQPAKAETAQKAVQDTNKTLAKDNPFFALLKPDAENSGNTSTPEVGIAKMGDTARINAWLNNPRVKNAIGRDDVKFMWTYKAKENKGQKTQNFSLIAIKTNRSGIAPLDGGAVENTFPDRDQNNRNVVRMTMNSVGANKWKTITTDNKGRSVAVVLDGYVYTYPTVNDVIASGSSEISGDFSAEEATDLSNILKAGKLPAPARIEGEEIVGPTLGETAINSGMISFLISFLLVIAFVQFYYRGAGTIANIALLCNLFFILGVCASQNVVLTLPGIAGIILSMAMAVDANVLIYERVREDLEQGKTTKTAITSGFQDALASIIDGNITTFITGVILFVFGTGPIRGFAVTLMVGIITTLISALLITRLLLDRQLNQAGGVTLSFGNRAANKFFNAQKIEFIGNRKKYYTFVGAIVLVSFISFGAFQFKMGVDFLGGRSYIVDVQEAPKIDEMRDKLKGVFKDEPVIKTVGVGNQVMITTSYLYDQQDADDQVRNTLATTLKSIHPKFENSDKFIVGETKVGPTVAKDIIVGAFYSVLFSLIAIFIYIFVRFQRWQFGIGAIASLAFNVIATLGIFSLLGAISDYLPFSVEVNQTFIGAVLTIVGYTINDTVVVFDRIREKLAEDRGRTAPETLFNGALNDTLSRTLVTAVTTLMSALILMIFGGEVLSGFMFALIFGILVGTFSSICIASPITLDLLLREKKNQEANKTVATAK